VGQGGQNLNFAIPAERVAALPGRRAGVGGGSLLEYWTAQVWAKIESEWVPPRIGLGRAESLAVTVSFLVTRDGRILSVRVRESSGNPDLDRSAERALADAAPLPPLPPFFRRESVEVTVTFRATGRD
jgi:TonB family protein